jgi:amino acid permease
MKRILLFFFTNDYILLILFHVSMILADTFQALAAGMGMALTRTQSLVGITSLVLLPLCFLKNLSSLAPFSLVGIAGMLYTTIAMAIRYLGGSYGLPHGKFLDSIMALPAFGTKGASSVVNPRSLILMCMLSNAYIAHFNAPKFFYELKDRTLGRFNQVVGWSFGASIVLYSIISGLGFLTFGAASNGLILNNYSTKDVLMGFSRIAVALSVIGRYERSMI